MKIAYVISAYKLPQQLVRLVDRLNTEAASFFIHIDRKSDPETYRQMVGGLKGRENVYFLERHDCYWGDMGHLRTTMKGIREISNRGASIDYMVLLSGQDYPIKPNNHIEKVFRENYGKIFLSHLPLPREGWAGGGMDRIERWHFWYRGRHLSLPLKRRFPERFRPFGGSAYCCLPGDCVEYINGFAEKNRAFVDFFKHVYVPEEIFLHTVIMNSAFRERVVNDDLRYIDWSDRTSSPDVLRKEDFDKLAGSSDLFARKFDVTMDAEVLDMVDRDLLG